MVKIIQASVCLHNYLKQTDTARYCRTGFSDSYDKSGNLLPGSWRDEVEVPLRPVRSRSGRPSLQGLAVRDAYMLYFNSPEGSLPWQLKYVQSTGNRPDH